MPGHHRHPPQPRRRADQAASPSSAASSASPRRSRSSSTRTTPTADRVVDHIEHVVEVAGIDHVGLGPDFIDDYYQQVYGGWSSRRTSASTYAHAEVARPSDLPKITEALLRRGFAEADIRKVLGENVLRVLRQVLA